ncbi:MAG: hypothetical protein WC714_28525 [Candidatus Obscuribacterales bacterium]|jgi:hypothetical protein
MSNYSAQVTFKGCEVFTPLMDAASSKEARKKARKFATDCYKNRTIKSIKLFGPVAESLEERPF